MIDLYMEAKRREQERLDEAKIWRMLKSAQREAAKGRVGLRAHFLNWLGMYIAASGSKLQAQFK